MKKYMALILALAMVIVPLASCADKTDDGGGGGGGEAKSTDAATGGRGNAGGDREHRRIRRPEGLCRRRGLHVPRSGDRALQLYADRL